MTLGFLICLAAAALVLEGFFSGSEMALISADRLSLHKQAQSGSRGAKLALKLMNKPEHVLATTLVGTNACVAFQACLATLYVYKTYGPRVEPLTVLVLSPLVLVFGEIIPKTFAQRFAESVAPSVAPLVQLAGWVLSPLVWFMRHYASWLSRKLEPIEELFTGRSRHTHREELRYLLTYGQKETSIKTSERRMIRRILDFSKADAKKALLPLIKVDMIEDTTTVGDALDAFTRFRHSRLPVYHDRVDNVVGVLHLFDLFSEQDQARPVTQVMRPPHYAPESQQLEKLLYTMQRRGIQMTVVVDEYGGAVGILALEDILEEIVGEIKDEFDEDAALYRQTGEHEFVIQGQMEIDAINELIKLGLPHGEYETLAGFLLQQFDRIPEEGDELYYGSLKFTVRKASNRVIHTVHIQVLLK